MALEDRVAKLESEMFQLKIGSLQIPTTSPLRDTTRSIGDWAANVCLIILFTWAAFLVGLAAGEHVERRNANHNTPASVRGPVSPPDHDTLEDPR